MIALLSAVAVLMSLMAIYASPAEAHHPTTTAGVACDGPNVVITYRSTSWQNGSGHGDIRIEVSVAGGSWTQVASGAYTAANGYTFSGTFPGDAYVGQSIRVRSWAVGNWNSGAGAGNGNPDATTAPFTVTDNNCDPGDEDVTVTVGSGVCEVVQGQALGSIAIAINPASGATVNVYSDAAHTNLVGSVTSSGSVGNLAPGTYYWTATAADGYELTGSGSGQVVIEDCTPPPPPSGWACVDGDAVFIPDATDFEGTLYPSEQDAMNDPDCQGVAAETTFSIAGACVPGDAGAASFTISGSLGEGLTLDVAGQTVSTSGPFSIDVGAAGSYAYEITLDDGFVLADGAPSADGVVVIEDCSPQVGAAISVTVNSGCAVNNGVDQGEIAVTISVDGGATVTITDSNDVVLGTFTSDGTLTVPDDATYTWVATPSEGFEFSDDFVSSGTVEIGSCTPEVMASIQVTVSGSCELDGDEGEGFVDISMSVPNGATVVVRDSDGDVVGTVTDDATLSVPEGATYTWQATPNEGFEFPSGFASSGSITIERCSDPDSLPFTGFDPMGMGLFAILLVGAGITAINKAPREDS